MPLRDVQLVVAGRRAAPARHADAPRVAPHDLGPIEMVLQAAPCLGAELGVAHYDSRAVDQRDTIPERVTALMRQLRRRPSRVPLRRDRAADARELVALLDHQAVAQAAAGDEHDRGDERRDDDRASRRADAGERHAGRLCGLRSR
jgi:hypothetical protein